MANTINIVSKDILCHMNKKFYSTSILKLRDKFPGFSDEDYARFLIARDGIIEKAEEMLKAHVAWRASNLPIYKESCLGEILKGKVYVHGTDKEGHPLVHFRPKLNDADTRDVEEMGRMALWWCEVIFKQIPPSFSKATLLVNRTGGESNADVPFIRLLAGVFQANHPERLYKAVIYPSGVVFWVLWNMLKHLADPVTQAKISPVLWQSGVKDTVPDEFIPKEIGGLSEYDAEFDANKAAIVAAMPDPFPKEPAEEAAAREEGAADAEAPAESVFNMEKMAAATGSAESS